MLFRVLSLLSLFLSATAAQPVEIIDLSLGAFSFRDNMWVWPYDNPIVTIGGYPMPPIRNGGLYGFEIGEDLNSKFDGSTYFIDMQRSNYIAVMQFYTNALQLSPDRTATVDCNATGLGIFSLNNGLHWLTIYPDANGNLSFGCWLNGTYYGAAYIEYLQLVKNVYTLEVSFETSSIRPSDTSYDYYTNVYAVLTDPFGNRAAGKTITFSSEPIDGTGGHDHVGGRPSGNLSSNTCVTGGDGVCSIVYTAPEISGSETIVATMSDAPSTSGSATIPI